MYRMVEKEYVKDGSPGELQLINKEDTPDSGISSKEDILYAFISAGRWSRANF